MAQQDRTTFQALIATLLTDGGANTATEIRTLLTNLSDSAKFFDESISDLTESEILDLFNDEAEYYNQSDGGSRRAPLHNFSPFVKTSVRLVAVSNGTLSSAFANGGTLDSVTLATGDRILLIGQTDASENGIYTVNASGAPTRAADMENSTQVRSGLIVSVDAGTTYAGSTYKITAPINGASFTLDTDDITFSSIGGGGSGDSWGDAVDADIVPDGDITRDLGSSANAFAQLHLSELYFSGNGLGNIRYESGDNTGSVNIYGGGGTGATDGAILQLFGASHASNAGDAHLTMPTGGDLLVKNQSGSTAMLRVRQSSLATEVESLLVTTELVHEEEVDDGNSSTADTIDFTAGNFHKSTMTGNCTYTFTAPSSPATLVLKLVQDATGSRVATWPGTVKWPGGFAPTLSTAASAVDIISFYYDGTNYYGFPGFAFA